MSIAAIFDMDGVIVDNGKYHLKAWEEFCNRHNISPGNSSQKIAESSNKELVGRISGKCRMAELTQWIVDSDKVITF